MTKTRAFNLHGAIFGLKKVVSNGYAHLPLLSLPITSSVVNLWKCLSQEGGGELLPIHSVK